MTELPPDARMTDKAIKQALDAALLATGTKGTMPHYVITKYDHAIADAAGLHGYQAMEQEPELRAVLTESHDLANRTSHAQDFLRRHYGGTWGELDTGKFRKALAAYRLQHPEGKSWVHESVEATKVGIEALDAGDYVTLDSLEEEGN